MNGKIFLDTNIIIYSYSANELSKTKIAQKVISSNITLISTQVLKELSNILTKKYNKNWTEVGIVIEEVCNNAQLYINTKSTIKLACQVADKYKFSFYDSLIIASAIESDCKQLYSEDLQHKQVIEEKLLIFNPFV